MGEEKTYFGIDLGTENIGYAVTNENYKIKKAYGKRAIGVRFFDGANTASERRSYRASRRRLERRKYRINLLQELFDEEMNKVDSNFFKKLNENDLHIEDRSDANRKYSLFNDKNFNDKQYYKKYPTIYHLRRDLMVNPAKDIRLVYLAIHHIIKYRGNFLTIGDIKECRNPKGYFDKLNDAIEILHIESNNFDKENSPNDIEPLNIINIEKIENIIIDKSLRKKDKIAATCRALGAESSTQKAIVGTIFGNKVNLVSIFGKNKYTKEDLSKSEFYFSDDYSLIDPEIHDELDDYEYEIISNLKHLYDWQILTSMLDGKEYLSYAMVDKYNKHKEDLKALKRIIKKYAPDKYDSMFAEPVKNGEHTLDMNNVNYTYYVGGGVYNGTKLGKKYEDGKLVINKEQISRNGRLGVTCEVKEDFYKTVKNIIAHLVINNQKDKKIVDQMLKDMDDGNFMPKIVSKNKATIPYQLNMIELEKILDTQSRHFKFLNEKTDGYSVCEKIKMLLKFRIPYYIGPVKVVKDVEESKNKWAVRNPDMDNLRVTPWTFDIAIDKAASNKQFIERMTTYCTYLKREKTLPRKSLLFSTFTVLSELNKLKFDNGDYLDVELKQRIFKDVYLNGKDKPSKKDLSKYIKSVGINDINLVFPDCDLQGTMKTYRDFKKIIGEKVDKYPDMVEKIIFYCTIFAEDSNMVEEIVSKEFGDNSNPCSLTKAQIKSIKNLRFEGWSSLSKGLLMGTREGAHGITLLDAQNNRHDIIELMWNSNLNLMEIINKYDFEGELKEYNKNNNIIEKADISYEDVEELYCSPSVKRGIWQVFKIVEELTKIFGQPDKIFIETTREHNNKIQREKRKTISRQRQMIYMYEEACKQSKQLYHEIVDASGKLYDRLCAMDSLNSEKMYLYYLQLGRDMYTNKVIDLDNLNNYDVDHIIPQSLTKDDSLNNKVLVEKVINGEKSNMYPLPNNCRQVELWKNLKALKLLTEDKYNRLMRTSPITEDEKEKFINRQLVETNQMVKEAANLFNRYYNSKNRVKKTEIVLSKASNVSMFRREYNLTKSRDANNFHHGVDAYLNIVVGNVLNEKFNHNRQIIKDGIIDRERDKTNDTSNNFQRAFYSNIYSYREKRTVWIPIGDDNSTIKYIEKEIDNYDYQMSKKVVTKNGELFKSTIYKAGMGNYPIKEGVKSDITKYGAKKTSSTAYFIIVDSFDKQGKHIRSIEAMPIYYDKQIKLGKIKLEDYLKNELGLINPSIAKITGLNDGKLLVGSLFEFEEGKIKIKLRLAGITGKSLIMHNANELYVNNDQNNYIKEMSLIIDKVNKRYLHIKNDSEEYKNKTDEELKLLAFDELMMDKERRIKSDHHACHIIQLSKDKNLELYKFFIDKLSNDKSPYKYIATYDSLKNILQLGENSFISMKTYEQVLVLLKLLVAFQCNASVVDASDIQYVDKNGKIKKGGANQCSIKINNNITNKQVSFISQSVTGLKERHILLNSHGI